MQNGQRVRGPHNFCDEPSGGFALQGKVELGAHARVNHQRHIQRQMRFRLKNIYVLANTFLVKLKGFFWQIGNRPAFAIGDTGQNVYQVYFDADWLLLRRRVKHRCCSGNHNEQNSDYRESQAMKRKKWFSHPVT